MTIKQHIETLSNAIDTQHDTKEVAALYEIEDKYNNLLTELQILVLRNYGQPSSVHVSALDDARNTIAKATA